VLLRFSNQIGVQARYGDAARNESTIRGDELTTAGDDNAAAIWLRIARNMSIWAITPPLPAAF
jgi:hypothetical protein